MYSLGGFALPLWQLAEGFARSRGQFESFLKYDWSKLQIEISACNWNTTFNSGCLGSHTDEERCELRYVMRIAEFSESSKFWTHIALSGYAWKYACISVRTTNLSFFFCVVRKRDGRMWGVSLAPSSEEKMRVPLNVRSLFLVFKMKCGSRTQWSVWIALR